MAELARMFKSEAIRFVQDQLFPRVMAETRANLTGRMLNRGTGATLADVEDLSGLTRDGFRLETSMPGLIARLKGSPRKGFFVRPVRAKALAFRLGGPQPRNALGQFQTNLVFSRGHWIPPWRFPKVDVFQDAIDRVVNSSIGAELERWMHERVFRSFFRGRKRTFRVL